MRILALLLLVLSCGKTKSHLPDHFVAEQIPETATVVPEAETNFKSILNAQGDALNTMTEVSGSFQMKEMITDIAVAKTGLLGLSALKSNNGVEIKWARKTLTDFTPHEKADYLFEQETTVEDATRAVAALVEASGKLKVTPRLRGKISQSLSQIHSLIQEVSISGLSNWDFKGIRFDLNFSAGGEIFFFTKAGPNLRLRMEWAYARPALKSSGKASAFIMRTLNILNHIHHEIHLPGFTASKLSLGVGTTYKGEWGLWKYSSGFMGFLLFVPGSRKVFSSETPLESEDFLVGGFDEKSNSVSGISPEKFLAGLRKSLETASFFAEAAESERGNWFVKEIKTVNDISYTGLFGLADYTTKGAMEIDFKRNN
ncbi:MAG: hypothetical protein V4598_05170 [Bdellovibrionota bacterium]